jgi:hypothetical protein
MAHSRIVGAEWLLDGGRPDADVSRRTERRVRGLPRWDCERPERAYIWTQKDHPHLRAMMVAECRRNQRSALLMVLS